MSPETAFGKIIAKLTYYSSRFYYHGSSIVHKELVLYCSQRGDQVCQGQKPN